MNTNEVLLHGECMVFPSTLPAAAKKIDKKRIVRSNGQKYVIVADSETTGNHHVVDVVDGVDIYENEGSLFMVNSVGTNIRCLHENRHDTKTLSPGTYEFGSQQEYDPFAARMQKVRD